MTSDEIRMAIGEACGMKWYVAYPGPGQRRFLSWPGVRIEGDGVVEASMDEPIAAVNWSWFKHMLEYTDNADHIASARSCLITTNLLRVNFMNTLRSILERRIDKPSDYDCLDSEPSEQAEALLRVINKWKE